MKGLEECMRKGVSSGDRREEDELRREVTDDFSHYFNSFLQAAARPVRARPTINYHLAKWSKRI